MIDLYYWPTPNGWKITIALEEMGLEYRIIPVNIGRGDQFKPEFLAISPNNRMPAIIDHDPPGGGVPIPIFESAAILIYLAEKTGKFLLKDLRGRKEVLEWVTWQIANLGPMLGQTHHFRVYAPEQIPYAVERYTNEANRLYGVLDGRLKDREYIAGEYTIADMACWPWIIPHPMQGQDLDAFPNVKRWYDKMKSRPAVQKGFQVDVDRDKLKMDDEARKILFGQRARK